MVLLGSILCIYNFSLENSKIVVYVISGILFILGVLISVIQKKPL
jgi:hypothetical protein